MSESNDSSQKNKNLKGGTGNEWTQQGGPESGSEDNESSEEPDEDEQL
jgi:hypothetical protein